VPDSAEAKFMVIVLPGGSVMNDGVKLIKSSGNAAYDSAAERAIYKAQPLPMPQDEALARMFRELRLSVKP
jgi:colicin import membrane protein